MKKPPAGVLEQRPGLDPTEQHPSNGPHLGPAPAKYSRAVHDAIVANIRAGNRPHVAAGIAGITTDTFYRWLQLGKSGDVHLWEFARDVELAEHSAEGEAVEVVKKAFAADPEAAKWWLERARSAGYSKQVKTLVESQLQEFMKRLEEGLPPGIFELVLAIYAGQTPPSTSTDEEKPPAIH